MPTNYNHGQSDRSFFNQYGRNSNTIGSRLDALFSNRNLGLNQDRRKRLIGEVEGGRTFDNIRSALDPYTDGGGANAHSDALGIHRDEITSALEAINARFGRERTGLESSRDAVKRAFNLLSDQFSERRDEELEVGKERAAGSGRIRSGLFLDDQARVADTFADRLTRARAERDAELSPIQQALATLAARRDEQREAEARRLAREAVGTREAIAQALQLV